MGVYHWKRESHAQAPISDFSAFVKLQTRRSNREILLIYLVIAFIFGLAGNLAASGIQALWDQVGTETPAMKAPAADRKLVPASPAPSGTPAAAETRRAQLNSLISEERRVGKECVSTCRFSW